ncbi:hypothetical protein D3C79_992310 [compost metagenome]
MRNDQHITALVPGGEILHKGKSAQLQLLVFFLSKLQQIPFLAPFRFALQSSHPLDLSVGTFPYTLIRLE